mmetsp:Transcript_18291/g.55000  ORF Transcript_18291/g.55000 Transcript_18291/m.55000 type:complete len:572 (+) Transcript_18291:826-2541(+)
MGVLPHGCRDDHLHLLTTGEAADVGVGAELGLDAQVHQVLLHHAGGQRALVQPLRGRLLGVQGGHQLLHTHLDQLVTRHPLVVLWVQTLELHLVLVRALELAAGGELLDLALLAVDNVNGVQVLLVFIVDLAVDLGQSLPILADGIPPLDVLVGGLLEVLLHVVEGVLGHVGDSQVGMLPHHTVLGLRLACEQLDDGGLACAVGANAGNAGVEAALQRHVAHHVLVHARVPEADLVHLENGAVLGLDALQEPGLGEDKLDGALLQVVVRPRLRLLLHERRQVAPVALQLAVLVVDDVSAHSVQEATVVGHNHAGHVGQAVQVALQPGHVVDVQVVGGLVQQQNVCLHQHSAGKSELHLPAARQGGDGRLLHLSGEAHAGEHPLHLCAVRGAGGLEDGVQENVLDHCGVRLAGIDVVLHKHGAQLGLGGEAVQLLVGDGAHQRRLAGAVGAAQTIAAPALEPEAGVGQQNLATVGQRELAVAQVLALVVLQLLDCLAGDLLEAAGQEGLVHRARLVAQHGAQERVHCLVLPGVGLEVANVDEVGCQGGNVQHSRLVLSSQLHVGGIGCDDLL